MLLGAHHPVADPVTPGPCKVCNGPHEKPVLKAEEELAVLDKKGVRSIGLDGPYGLIEEVRPPLLVQQATSGPARRPWLAQGATP